MNQNELRDLALRYPVTIRPDADEGYVAIIPDFPRVYTNGDTPAEALANAYGCRPGGAAGPAARA